MSALDVFCVSAGLLLLLFLGQAICSLCRLRHKKKDSGLVLVRGEEEPKRLTLIYHKGYAAEFNPDRDWAERWCIFSRYLDEEGVFYTDTGEHADELLRFFAGPEEGGQG